MVFDRLTVRKVDTFGMVGVWLSPCCTEQLQNCCSSGFFLINNLRFIFAMTPSGALADFRQETVLIYLTQGWIGTRAVHGS